MKREKLRGFYVLDCGHLNIRLDEEPCQKRVRNMCNSCRNVRVEAVSSSRQRVEWESESE